MGLATLFVAAPAQAERARGVDVSQWQLDMNWNTTYDQGIRFAFVRSSRGGTTPAAGMVIDERFYENMGEIDALAAAGKTIYAGAYHFGRWDTIGPVVNNTIIQTHARDQAQHFYNVAGDYMTPGYLRPVLDLELDSSPDPTTPPLTKAQLSLWSNAFMDHIEQLSGVEPLIYTNTNFATNEVDTSLSHRDLWLARYNDLPFDPQVDQPKAPNPPFPNPYGAWNDPFGSEVASHDAWSFWQYSNYATGSIYGAGSAAIDLDVANGDINFVRSFLIPEPTGATLALLLGLAHLGSRRRRRSA
jgi:MYXO-CTERM domain-containing protein